MWRTGLAESILRITQKILKVQYNMTANIKVEKLLDYCHQNGKKVLCVADLSGVKDRKQH